MWLVFLVTLLLSLVGVSQGFCVTDDDCNLNGVCTDANECKCDPGWTKETCSWLKLKPAKLNSGYRNSTAATWGGSMFKAPDGYHMYVAQMLNECGLGTWVSNSIIVHTKSKHIEGPYVYVEDIFPAWSHNPQPHRAPDGTYLIYHIGNGTEYPGQPPLNCSNFLEQPNVQKPLRKPWEKKKRTTPFNHLTVHYLHSRSPLGPWEPVEGEREDPCDNPTVYFFPNGSLILLYRMDIISNFSNWISELHLATADSWKGPYITQSKLNSGGPIFQRQGEDPFIYRDERGNFHALFHDMEDGYPVQTSWSGSHAFSRDGLHWTWTPLPAYTSIVEYENGWTARYARRERPQIFTERNKKGKKRAFLSNGIQITSSDDMTFTLVQEIDLS